jgi:hypothetical protein
MTTQYTLTLTLGQADAVGFALRTALREQKSKLQDCPEDPWRRSLVQHLADTVLQLEIAPGKEAA